MSVPTDPVTEAAKATQEVAKATGKALDASREVGGFISKYIAGPLEQGMGIFEDRLRYLRWESQLRLMRRAEETLKHLGMTTPTRAVPLKIAIPLLQAASIEEDDQLQDRWVNLLVNAANEGSGVEISRSYIAILEQLTPIEAQILDVIYALPFEEIQHDGACTRDLPRSARTRTEEERKKEQTFEICNEVKLALGNLERVGCIRIPATWGGGESFHWVNPTVLGKAFVNACKLPRT